MAQQFSLYVVNKNYIQYLKMFDKKVPDVEYEGRSKLFLGKIKINNSGANYFIPLTSYKRKFETIEDRLDFIKLVDYDGTIIGAIDINNMIPVPDIAVKEFSFAILDELRSFKSKTERNTYYSFSQKELKALNELSDRIVKNAKILYSICRNDKYPAIKERCCNFEELEIRSIEYRDILNAEVEDLMENITSQFFELNSDDDYLNYIDKTEKGKGYEK